jgi:branched-chain amino acid transport system permease protein
LAGSRITAPSRTSVLELGRADIRTWTVATAFVFLLPAVLGNRYYLNAMNFIALYSMVAIGLCLLTGYGGQLSMSHAAFFAIGAYGSSILCLRAGFHPILAIFLSQIVSALISWGIGWIVLRLKGHYLAIATLSFTVIVEHILKNWVKLTGGLQGLSAIPPVSMAGFAINTDWRFYFLVWPVMMLLQLFALNLVDSRTGRVLKAIKEGEDVARLFGADVKKYKIKLFILSSVYASLAGSLYAHYVTFVSPSVGSVMFAIEIVLALAFGGYTMLWGAMLGVASINLLNQYLTAFAEYKQVIYGLALIIIMMFFPNGLLHGIRDYGRSVLHLSRREREA